MKGAITSPVNKKNEKLPANYGFKSHPSSPEHIKRVGGQLGSGHMSDQSNKGKEPHNDVTRVQSHYRKTRSDNDGDE